ncbi:hypothetical protein [Flavobacterium sp.]|uniref:hypothetical protein n=4 Tax=Pseudomonadati TaxID=3379134 RepID=UPI004048DBA0
MNSQCACYDFRYNADGISSDMIKKWLKGIAKRYVFQQEVGDSGYNHFQGRLSLVKKRRKHEALKLFENPPNYFEPTTNIEYYSGDAFYQTKIDTRVDGPWTDKDEVIYIPRQVREMGGLRPFQQVIVDDVNVWDKRTINLVYCQEGNKGKSCLVSYMRANKLGRALPPVNDYKDLLRMVCDLPTSKLYLFDMPRAMNKDKMFQFYSAVETIKDGYAYDDRYSFKEKVFDCPNIWIFCNVLPDLGLLSMDRWKIWDIDNAFNFVKYNIEGCYNG